MIHRLLFEKASPKKGSGLHHWNKTMALICSLLFCYNSLKTNFNFNLSVFSSLSVQSRFDYGRSGGNGGRGGGGSDGVCLCVCVCVGGTVAGENGRQHTRAVLSICL